MTKLSEFPSLPVVDRLDSRHQLDVDDTSGGPGGTNKQQTFAEEQDQGDLWRFPLNLAALPALGPLHTDKDFVYVKGHTTIGDGGQGYWRLDESSVLTPDNGLVVTSSGSGNWVRVIDGTVTPKMWGAKGDGSTDDTVALTSAFAAIKTAALKVRRMFFPDGTYITDAGLEIDGDDVIIDGAAEIKLIDNATAAGNGFGMLRIAGSRNQILGLTFRGNTISPPSYDPGTNLLVTGTDNLIDSCRFFDSRSTGNVNQQDNIRVTGDNNIISNCFSGNAFSALFYNGGDNQWLNCIGRRGTSTLKGFNSTGASGQSGTRLVIDGLDMDHILQCDWTSENNPQIMETVIVNACHILTLDNVAAKFAHVRYLRVSNSHFEARTVGDQGLSLGERMFDATFINTYFKGTGESHVMSFPAAAGRKQQSINNLTFDGCTFGGTEGDIREGTHTGAANQAVLTDTGQSPPFIVNELTGWTITNLTDGSSAEVTSNTSNTVTGALSGGIEDDWDFDDRYTIYEGPDDNLGQNGIDVNCFNLIVRNCVFNRYNVAAIKAVPQQQGIIDVRNTPPALTGGGDVYIIGLAPTGLWVDRPDFLAWDHPTAAAWVFEAPTYGLRIFNEDVDDWLMYINTIEGWQTVRDELFGVEVTGNKFIGYRTATLLAFRADSPSGGVGELRMQRPSDRVKFYDNNIINLQTVSATFTADTANDELDDVAHGRSVDDVLYLTTTGTLPAGLSLNLKYYLIDATTGASNDAFSVSLTKRGVAEIITTIGSGIHTYTSTIKTQATSSSNIQPVYQQLGPNSWFAETVPTTGHWKIDDRIEKRPIVQLTETVTNGSPALSIVASYEVDHWKCIVSGPVGVFVMEAFPRLSTTLTLLDSSGGAITGTLADGTINGQIKTITMIDATTSSTITVANHATSIPEIFTFNAVNETLTLEWQDNDGVWTTVFATATV